MNTVALIVIVLLLIGVGCVMAALAQLWAVGGGVDDPVGPRRPRTQRPAAPPVIPGTFRSLIQGETTQWKQIHHWEALTQHLNRLEADFGGVPSMPAPENYSAEWLEQRIAKIETLAGPLPAPLRPTPAPVKSRLLWKK